ncbi:MAG: arsenate reductase (glutaredoxin) [Gammaproteobacteria bacterium]|nr:arsenate reductase (glutaredoxin) [Gammaproteobacteria bacterium]MCK5091683.1 arsenate reductase (glutaredoxin) [Gammaproteobacteria bacterium]
MSHEEKNIRIFHNPKCSKSRQTLQILHDRNTNPQIIEYLKTPPNESELEEILKLLGMEPRDLMRKKEDIYKELKLDDTSLDRQNLIRAMIENPKLIERPIVLSNNKATIGRPPENVIGLL